MPLWHSGDEVPMAWQIRGKNDETSEFPNEFAESLANDQYNST